MVRIKDYMEAAYDKLITVVDKIYLKDRPKAVDAKTDCYAVIDIPSYVSNREMDYNGSYDYYVTTVNILLFVRDKVTPKHLENLHIVKMDKLLKNVQALFPIADRERNVKIHRQRIVVSDSDGDGWHYALISARLTTYF